MDKPQDPEAAETVKTTSVPAVDLSRLVLGSSECKGLTHYAGCACHEKGWQNKWECAVEMAARAKVECDDARRMWSIHQDRLAEACELIAEIMRDEVNIVDECEKFLRAYAPHHLFPERFGLLTDRGGERIESRIKLSRPYR